MLERPYTDGGLGLPPKWKSPSFIFPSAPSPSYVLVFDQGLFADIPRLLLKPRSSHRVLAHLHGSDNELLRSERSIPFLVHASLIIEAAESAYRVESDNLYSHQRQQSRLRVAAMLPR